VPLSKQALAILKALKPITGEGEYMFPAIGPKRRPISENTVGAALQLAHRDKNKIRGIYNRAERLKERTRMMQEWFDHLDALRIGGKRPDDHQEARMKRAKP
jgi:integrase